MAFQPQINSPFGGPMNGNNMQAMFAMQMQMMQLMEMMMMMMQMQMQMSQMASAGGPGGFANTNMNDGLAGYLGIPGGLPAAPSPWAQSPGNTCNYVPPTYCSMGNNGNGNCASAVNLGQRFIGQNSCDLRGQLGHFTAAGGQNKNCADFVSACLESTGQLQGHHVGVSDLEQSLIKQGYHQVSAAQAKPGDVYITEARSHTELVAAPGATRLLGSNNDRPDHQRISEVSHDPNKGIYYSRA